MRPNVERLIEVISGYYRMDRNEIGRGRRGKENEARDIAIYLAHEVCDMRYSEIARRFQLNNSGTVGWYCMKVRKKMDKTSGFRKRIKSILALVKKTTSQHEI